MALPGFSPRLAFGCCSGVAGLKLVARNFTAAFLRCMDLTRQTPGVARFFTAPCLRLSPRHGRTENYCPKLRRALPSVVAPARLDRKLLSAFSPRLAFGCQPCAAGQKIIARNFTAPCLRLSAMCGRTENYCPKLQRGTTSVHGFDAADARTLPGFSPRLAFGCRSGAAGQKIVARVFTAPCFRLSLRRGRTDNYCPSFHRALLSVVAPARLDKKLLPAFSPRLAFGCQPCAAGQKIIARNFTAPCFWLLLRRGRTETRCPKLHRGLPSVHGFDAADARALPEFSPRLAFGCQPCAAGQKIIARNFNAAFLRCMDLTRQTPGHCPFFHRALLSVVAPARPDRKLLLETSPRLTFGCRSGAAGQKIVVRFFTATCFRLSAMRSRTENHCPKFLRGRHRLNIIQPCGRKFIFLLFLFRFAFNNQ